MAILPSGVTLYHRGVLHTSCRKDSVPKYYLALTRYFADHGLEIISLGLALLRPWRKVSHLTIVPVIGQEHLWPNQKNLPVQD